MPETGLKFHFAISSNNGTADVNCRVEHILSILMMISYDLPFISVTSYLSSQFQLLL